VRRRDVREGWRAPFQLPEMGSRLLRMRMVPQAAVRTASLVAVHSDVLFVSLCRILSLPPVAPPRGTMLPCMHTRIPFLTARVAITPHLS